MIAFENGETYIKSIRRHWLFFASELVFYAVLAVIPLAVYAVFGETVVSVIERGAILKGNTEGFLLFCYSGYLLFLWLGVCLVWTDYYLDIWIVTDQRIVDVEQNGLFNRKISEFRLDMIQDVTIKVPSLFATMFGYGDINIQTASEASKFDFRGVAHPEAMRTLIMNLHHKAVEKPQKVNFS